MKIKIFSVEEWENGRYLPDDEYQPQYDYNFGFRFLTCFVGKRFRYVLSRGFADILEK